MQSSFEASGRGEPSSQPCDFAQDGDASYAGHASHAGHAGHTRHAGSFVTGEGKGAPWGSVREAPEWQALFVSGVAKEKEEEGPAGQQCPNLTHGWVWCR